MGWFRTSRSGKQITRRRGEVTKRHRHILERVLLPEFGEREGPSLRSDNARRVRTCGGCPDRQGGNPRIWTIAVGHGLARGRPLGQTSKKRYKPNDKAAASPKASAMEARTAHACELLRPFQLARIRQQVGESSIEIRAEPSDVGPLLDGRSFVPAALLKAPKE